MHLDSFLENLIATDASPHTVDSYRRALTSFRDWFRLTNNTPPQDSTVTPLDIREYRQYLMTVRRLSRNTVNHSLAALRAYFRWSVEAGHVATSPAAAIRNVAAAPSPAPHSLERRDVLALRRAAQERIQIAASKHNEYSYRQAIRNHTILVLLLNTGLRVAELCALHDDDVTLAPRSGTVTVRSGKGEKTRTIPLNADARNALTEWRDVRREKAPPALFTGQSGNPLTPRGVQSVIASLANYANIENVSPHTLRHTFARNLVDSGVPLPDVSALLGHANLNTTMIYTRPSARDMAAAVQKISWTD